MQDKRLMKFLDTAVSMHDEDARQAEKLGFSARVLVQASLPHRTPRQTQLQNGRWIRRNGNFALIMQQGCDIEGKDLGFPYGSIPRLLLAYFSTEAVKTKNREISLGNSLSEFMRAIGMYSNGRDIKRLKTQLNRLLSASIAFRYEGEDTGVAGSNRPIARKFFFWWDEKNPNQGTLFKNSIVLDEEFYEEIITHPVPIDMRAIDVLKQSSLALDYYTWLTYRVFSLKSKQEIPWKILHQQVGSDYARTIDFKRKSEQALRKIKALWPSLKIEETADSLIIKPSKPHISPKVQILGYKI
jgi:hypothetical protein